jgi:hypothetical protein
MTAHHARDFLALTAGGILYVPASNTLPTSLKIWVCEMTFPVLFEKIFERLLFLTKIIGAVIRQC